MKKIVLALLAVTLLGCFITSAAEVKSVNKESITVQYTNKSLSEITSGIKNNKNIEPLNIKITSTYTELVKNVKSDPAALNKIIKNINNNKSSDPIDFQTTALYMKLINSVKPTTVAVQDNDSAIKNITSSLNNNNNSLKPLNDNITALYTKLINAVPA
ncbi:MAG TPA: hypothetical protein QF753_17735 [Victivallales bacterium]|nr:hypothetical protein [Victivallales bacterium]